MTCGACGKTNPAGQKFCGECGARLSSGCPSCGTENPPGQKFCGECGAPLGTLPADGPRAASTVAPATSPPTPVAERRLVSVLFADLVGFTAASEGRDAEDTRELLSRYFDTCRRLIELYGGTVEKFIGDAVMAVWGTPVATEDDAERAVRAALDLAAAVTALGDEVGAPDLRARAGVLTGEAAVTLGATDQGMVAGDLVNTASRIQSAAEPGTVLVGEATRRATETAIAYETAGAHELKGKTEPVQLWRALRVVANRGGEGRSAGLEAPFVGRDRELRLVKDLFHASAEERKAHLISITGVAGIGKSRMLWEFEKHIDGLADDAYWHKGRCLAYGDGVTYWALADMVRMRCRILEDEDPASALGKLRSTLDEHLLDADDRRFVEPRLAQLLGLGNAEATDRQELFAAWRTFFERLSDQYPTILAFEDMQWADESLLDFVEHLLEWSRNHPLYVVVLARPELVDRRPTWGAGLRAFTSVYLEPLAEEAMGQLLDGLVPGLPGSLREQILRRAEGVPLYAVETVRMLLDRGLLAADGAAYRLTGEVTELDVPETLHALIAARLDGLAPEERRVLQDGAVLGKTFSRVGLAALSGTGEEALEPLLAGLVRKEVLWLEADPRSPEQGQYGFLQDLVRHVAYETLSRRERHARHLAAAAYLADALTEDEVAEVIASHLVEAHRTASDDDAAALGERAREALVRAAERAQTLGGTTEAQRYLERAAELAPDEATRAALDHRAGALAWLGNRPSDARRLLEQAHAAFAALGDARAAARSSVVLGEIDFNEGHAVAAAERLAAAVETLQGGEEDADYAATLAQLARFLSFSGRLDEAAPVLDDALALGEALGLPEVIVNGLNTRALLLMRRDRPQEARVLLEGAVRIARDHELMSSLLRSTNNLLVTFDQLDETAEALPLQLEALETARRAGDDRWLAILEAGLVATLIQLGRWGEAVRLFAEMEESVSTAFVANAVIDVVPLRCERGEIAEARALLDRFAELGDADDPQGIVGWTTARATLLRAEGDLEAAQTAADLGVRQHEALGLTMAIIKLAVSEALEASLARRDEGRAEELLALIASLRPGERTPWWRAIDARYRARLGARRGEQADALFVEAATHYDELGFVFLAACTRLEHAEWLAGEGRSDEAAALLEQVRPTFDELEARPWLDRVVAAETTLAQREPASA